MSTSPCWAVRVMHVIQPTYHLQVDIQVINKTLALPTEACSFLHFSPFPTTVYPQSIPEFQQLDLILFPTSHNYTPNMSTSYQESCQSINLSMCLLHKMDQSKKEAFNQNTSEPSPWEVSQDKMTKSEKMNYFYSSFILYSIPQDSCLQDPYCHQITRLATLQSRSWNPLASQHPTGSTVGILLQLSDKNKKQNSGRNWTTSVLFMPLLCPLSQGH